LRRLEKFRANAPEEQLAIFGRIVDILDRNPEFGSPRVRIDALYDVASSLVRLKRHEEAQLQLEQAFKIRDSLPRQAMPSNPGLYFSQVFARLEGDPIENSKYLLAMLETLEQPSHPDLTELWRKLENTFASQAVDMPRARIAGSFRLEALALTKRLREKSFQREVDRVASYWERFEDYAGAAAFRNKVPGNLNTQESAISIQETRDVSLESLVRQFNKARREERKDDLDVLVVELMKAIQSDEIIVTNLKEEAARDVASHYMGKGDQVNAKLAAERAVAIAEKMRGKNHPENGLSITILAMVLEKLGDFKAIIPLYERIRANYLAHSENPKYARSAKKVEPYLPFVRMQAGEHASARRLFEETLWQVDAQNNLELKLERRIVIAFAAEEEERLDLAIHYGIQAVNILQVMRSRLTSLDQGLQHSFVKSRYYIYRQLAEWLIEAHRQAEALQVLRLMEQEDVFEFLGSDKAGGQQIEVSEQEMLWQTNQAEISTRAARIGVELAELDTLAGKRPLTKDEQSRRTALLSDREVARQSYEHPSRAFRAVGVHEET
jgi:tetratricopeptide (TPR) repeat protein